MNQDEHRYISILKNILLERAAADSTYSLRNFASDLGVDSSALSRILRGKQIPALNFAKLIADNLNLSEFVRRSFLSSIGEVRILELAGQVSLLIGESCDRSHILSEIVARLEPQKPLPFDIEPYRSLLKVLPCHSAVFSQNGEFLLASEGLTLDHLKFREAGSEINWIEKTAGNNGFNLEAQALVRGEPEKNLVFRISPIRNLSGVVVGWFATSFDDQYQYSTLVSNKAF